MFMCITEELTHSPGRIGGNVNEAEAKGAPMHRASGARTAAQRSDLLFKRLILFFRSLLMRETCQIRTIPAT
jgi:hypothetical protein